MDLYRYFHPHHNPRLLKMPLRLLELGELEQAASELRKALVRAQVRTSNEPVGGIRDEHFSEMMIAIDYIVESLQTLGQAHPGDDEETLKSVLIERENAPGWENWAALLRQRLHLLSSAEAPRAVANGTGAE